MDGFITAPFISLRTRLIYSILSNETLIDSSSTPRNTKAGSTGAPIDKINASITDISMTFSPELFRITICRFPLSWKISRTALPIEALPELVFAFVFLVVTTTISPYLG
jgi:hypothetical protein